jgi:predicted transposase YdaD
MLKNLGIISEWMEESEARGEARGEAAGRVMNAREMLLHVLERRFGTAPEALRAQISEASLEWCLATLDRALSVESYEELYAGI